jgi:hypothetical protein
VAVTVDSFKQTFDEFRKADNALVEAKLKLARLRVAASVWGAKADGGVLYLTAHLLALAPAGQNLKLKPETAAKTVYLIEFDRMKLEVTYGLRTAGLPPAGATDRPNNG